MVQDIESHRVELDASEPIRARLFRVYPFVLVGTREPDGSHDLAPKYLTVEAGDAIPFLSRLRISRLSRRIKPKAPC